MIAGIPLPEADADPLAVPLEDAPLHGPIVFVLYIDGVEAVLTTLWLCTKP